MFRECYQEKLRSPANKTRNINRSSRSQMFFKIGSLKNFGKFTRKHLRQSFLFNKVTPIFIEHLWWLLMYVECIFFFFLVSLSLFTRVLIFLHFKGMHYVKFSLKVLGTLIQSLRISILVTPLYIQTDAFHL